MTKDPSIFGEIISRYSRTQAIEDGVLVDVTETAQEAGFCCHTVITAALWHDIQNIPEHFAYYEDHIGRLWDVLQLAVFTARLPENASKSRCKCTMVLHTEKDLRMKQEIELLLDIGPGDDARPVLTIGYQSDF